jgi:predicted kinase
MSDLEARDQPQHAHCFLAGYLAGSGDYHACRVLNIYKAHRCLVRAKVAALGDQRAEHARLLEQARCALTARKPRLLLMHGLSGSGKTWLAQRLMPHLRAVHIRSDVERKRLVGLAAQARSASNIGDGLYSQQSSEQTYAHLTQCTEAVLSGGYDVIVDAAFARRADRARFKALADRCNASLLVIHCHAPDNVLRQRIESRRQAGRDASEADTNVLEWQQSNAEPLTREEKLDVLSVNTAHSGAVADIEKRLGEN